MSRICRTCGHENRATAKYCEACAVPLQRACPGRGSALRSTAKFCDECGQPVTASPAQRPTLSPSYTPKHLADNASQLASGQHPRSGRAHDRRAVPRQAARAGSAARVPLGTGGGTPPRDAMDHSRGPAHRHELRARGHATLAEGEIAPREGRRERPTGTAGARSVQGPAGSRGICGPGGRDPCHFRERQGIGRKPRRPIEAALAEAEALVANTGIRSWQPFIHVERAELARLVGDETTREHELREAHRLFTDMGAAGHAGRVAKELGC